MNAVYGDHGNGQDAQRATTAQQIEKSKLHTDPTAKYSYLCYPTTYLGNANALYTLMTNLLALGVVLAEVVLAAHLRRAGLGLGTQASVFVTL